MIEAELNSKQVRFLSNIFEKINKKFDFDSVFQLIYDNLKEFIPYNRIGVGIINYKTNEVYSIANRSDGEVYLDIGYTLSLEKTSLRDIIKTKTGRIINDLEQYYKENPDSESTNLILKEEIQSSLSLPLFIDGKAKGIIFFSSKEKNAYKQEDIEFLSQVSSHLATVIDKSRFITQLKEQNKELEETNSIKNEFVSRLKSEVNRQTEYLKVKNKQYEILLKIAYSSSIHFKIPNVLNDSFSLLKEYFKLESIAFIRSSFRKNKLKLSYIDGNEITTNYFDIFDTSFKSKYKDLFLDEKIINSKDLNASLEDVNFLKQKKLNYFIYIPIIFKKQFLGIVVLAKKQHSLFNKKEFKFIEELKEILKIGMHHLMQINQVNHDKEKLIKTSHYLSEEIKVNFGEIVGSSKKLKNVLRQIEKVAPTQSTVLIRGETGAGKELIARAIHSNSSRKDNIFVKVNCAALSDSLITSELFGHEKGAFTGAIEKKIGKFELANGGTLFLDEIGEIPLDFQVKLLRVLQEREFERVGGNKTVRVNIRLIAATNKDLELEIKEKKFRADLFYRLNVFPIYLPSLQERKDDIIPLAFHFIQKYNKVMNKSVTKMSDQTQHFLLKYHFPGNIRELENMIERGIILSEKDTLHLEASHYGVLIEENTIPEHLVKTEDVSSLNEVIEGHLRYAMEKSKWRIYGEQGAAKLLGLKPTTLQSKLKKFKIK